MKKLAVALFSFAFALSTAHAAPSELTLTGEIHDTDHQTYRLVPFDVPEGVSSLSIELDYTGRDQKTVIDVGLLGPGDSFERAFRGWSGGSKRAFGLSLYDATPSYLAAEVSPGRWHLVLGVPNIRKGQTASYRARIRFDEHETRALPATLLVDEARWYRGDLHMHSGHSDGSCDSRSGASRVSCPLFLNLDAAADRGLDFIAVTEHNTISHLQELTALQPYFDRLLLIPGIEITTFQGHANVFNATRPIDFRVGSDAVPNWNALLGSLPQSALASINHPNLPSGESCMGCGWLPKEPVDYERLAAVEVVNGYDVETPKSGIPFWHAHLQRGRRLTAVGGSDTHNVTAKGTVTSSPARIGVPTTVVFARELSTPAILEGIRAGKVFIDTQGTSHRMLNLTATIADRSVSMGDAIEAPRGTRIQWKIAVSGVRGGAVDVIQDGASLHQKLSNEITTDDYELSFEQRSDGKAHWVRADIRDAEGKLALIGNPIYVNASVREVR